MTIREYRCPQGHWTERDVPIREDGTPPVCECGQQTVRVFSMPHVAAAATPNKGHRTRQIDQTEREWSKDHAAYRRLRKEGIQPKQIDGAARAEANAISKTEIETGVRISDEWAKAAS